MREIHHKTIYETEVSHWWYRVRRKMVHNLIDRYYKNRHDLQILDLGCGTGALLQELSKYGHVSGKDISEQAISFCRSRGLQNVSVGSAMELNASDNTYDLVLALDVLEHIENDKKVLNEIYRVIKPGGYAIVFVPAFMFLWGITDVLSEHYRRYTRSELVKKAKEAGFNISRSTYFNFFLFIPISGLRLFMRAFSIPIESENKLGTPLTNKLFYLIFRAESFFVRFLKFPFGVSALVVLRK
jgi:2-polyprenyl-3-methyl-5-hydroxy-6-metoxy-1,4-benzoquinol methylase